MLVSEIYNSLTAKLGTTNEDRFTPKSKVVAIANAFKEVLTIYKPEEYWEDNDDLGGAVNGNKMVFAVPADYFMWVGLFKTGNENYQYKKINRIDFGKGMYSNVYTMFKNTHFWVSGSVTDLTFRYVSNADFLVDQEEATITAYLAKDLMLPVTFTEGLAFWAAKNILINAKRGDEAEVMRREGETSLNIAASNQAEQVNDYSLGRVRELYDEIPMFLGD